jgi:hypothetical protein
MENNQEPKKMRRSKEVRLGITALSAAMVIAALNSGCNEELKNRPQSPPLSNVVYQVDGTNVTRRVYYYPGFYQGYHQGYAGYPTHHHSSFILWGRSPLSPLYYHSSSGSRSLYSSSSGRHIVNSSRPSSKPYSSSSGISSSTTPSSKPGISSSPTTTSKPSVPHTTTVRAGFGTTGHSAVS